MQILGVIVQALITPKCVEEAGKVTGSIEKEAVWSMKSRKSDVSTAFSSDALLNAPDILFTQLAVIFRSWITHGKITPWLLACSFLPLLKSSLKDPADTGSYRAIPGSSLVQKIFEKVILLLWGHLLSSDSLQSCLKQLRILPRDLISYSAPTLTRRSRKASASMLLGRKEVSDSRHPLSCVVITSPGSQVQTTLVTIFMRVVCKTLML